MTETKNRGILSITYTKLEKLLNMEEGSILYVTTAEEYEAINIIHSDEGRGTFALLEGMCMPTTRLNLKTIFIPEERKVKE